MEDRIEILRNYIDTALLKRADTVERRCAYVHLYGVAQACAMIALTRGENVPLAIMAGMLHDFYTYKHMDSVNHAEKGALLARDVLEELKITDADETDLICAAIRNHSDKGGSFEPLEEVLIDADVLQHCLYNPGFNVREEYMERYEKLKREFGIR